MSCTQRGLAKKRRMVGMTQHNLARQTGISIGRIVFAETGRVALTPEEVERVQNVLRQRARKALEVVA